MSIAVSVDQGQLLFDEESFPITTLNLVFNTVTNVLSVNETFTVNITDTDLAGASGTDKFDTLVELV